MGIQMMAVTLAMVGVLTGSAVGATALAASAPVNTTQELPKMECVYAGDYVQDQLRVQDRSCAGDQAQDRDQIRTRDCVNTFDCTQDQLRT